MTLHIIVSDKGSVTAFTLRGRLRQLEKSDTGLLWKMHSVDEMATALRARQQDVFVLSVSERKVAKALLQDLRAQGYTVGINLDIPDLSEAADMLGADFYLTSEPENRKHRARPNLFVLPVEAEKEEIDNIIPANGPLPIYEQTPSPDGVNDWLFVTPKDSKGWILEAICREIGSRHPGTWEIVYNPKQLPKARNYFFAHYWNYMDAVRRNPHIREANTFVWYTHPREIPFTEEEQLAEYGAATQIIFTCSEYYRDWLAKGLPADKGRVVLGGADKFLFQGHARKQGKVGLSSSYYARKNPEVLFDLVRLMPHRRFHLVGRNWEEFPYFQEMLAMDNFTYQTASYAEYPGIYAQFDVFLSISTLEGGPIPLLEAMMCNSVPVASRTGFAPDLIRPGHNGYIFDVGSGADVIAPLIENAFELTTDVRSTVLDLTWDNFATEILGLGQSRD